MNHKKFIGKAAAMLLFLFLTLYFPFTGCSSFTGQASKQLDYSTPLEIPAPDLSRDPAAELAKMSVVQLCAETELGTVFGGGILWTRIRNERGEALSVIAAPWHVVCEGELSVVLRDGSELTPEIAYKDPKKDLVYLTVPEEELAASGKGSYAYTAIHGRHFRELDEEDVCRRVGMSEDGKQVSLQAASYVMEMVMEDYGGQIMLFDGPSEPGMSGYGVFDPFGDLVGMVVGGNEYYTLVISMEEITEQAKNLSEAYRDPENY